MKIMKIIKGPFILISLKHLEGEDSPVKVIQYPSDEVG